jgi:23S rRNA (cytosine1962-C5)-methyltransferase
VNSHVQGQAILKQGREKAIHNMHPWIFSGAIDERRSKLDEVEPGGIIDVRDAGGGFLARGYYNARSQIRVRLLTWDQNEVIGPAFWRVRLAQSIRARDTLAKQSDLNAYRLVYAESDGLPGLIVDKYGDYLVVQFLTLGMDAAKQTIVDALVALVKPKSIYERSDVDVRPKEGLPESVGLLYGEEPPNPVIMTEYGVQYPIDIYNGHKTGFYLDQKESRHWMLTNPAVQGADVLNAFSYTGSFGVCAAINGAASITNIDASQPALEAARQAMTLNGLNTKSEYVDADVFQQLRAYRDAERDFDIIILDPPKFAHSMGQVEAACRGYKDINLLAFELLRPGGYLMTFSCSGLVDADLFQKVVFGASVDAEVQAQIIGWLNQPEDHPILLSFPEGRYLKGLICRVAAF